MTFQLSRLLRCSGVLILFVVRMLLPGAVLAQEAVVPLQFSFSDPGARSMGFAGAFVALADDATAALANPAGLVQLLRPEVSIEGRHWRYSTPYTEGGRIEGMPSGIGIDTTVGLREATSEENLTGLSFFSLVYPKENWSLALFRHQLAKFEFSSETQGLFGGGSNCCQIREFDQRSITDLDIVSYGFSAAYRVNDKLSLGFAFMYHDVSFRSDATLFASDNDSVESLFAPNSYLPERSYLNEKISIENKDWTIAGGFLWRLAESWQIGGVYRQAPQVNLRTSLSAGDASDPRLEAGTALFEAELGLELPEQYGLGVAYRSPDDRLTISFQWSRVEYASIVDSLSLDDRAIDNADQLHLGAEYVLLDVTPIIALRIGAWLEPDHQLRATDSDPLPRALLPRGETDTHYTAGVGLAAGKFQIDLGVDLSKRVDMVSLSMIYSF